MASTVIATPRRGRLRGRTWWSDQPASDARRSRAARRNRRSQLGVAEPGPERGAERRRVAGRDEQARPDPVGAVTERLRQPADLGCDDRQATGQRLGDDHAVRLGARRQHQQVRGGVAAVEIGSGAWPREATPGRRARRRASGGGGPPRTPGRAPGCPRTRTARTGRSIVASASSSTSCPLPAVTAATHSSAPPAALPVARSAASTAGSATCTRSAGNGYSSSSRRRVHALVVTTAAAAERTARSRVRASSAPSSAGRWPSGMCTSTTSRNRLACGTSTSGAVEATSPSSSTTASSGIRSDDAGEGGAATPRRVAASGRARRARAPTSRSS